MKKILLTLFFLPLFCVGQSTFSNGTLNGNVDSSVTIDSHNAIRLNGNTTVYDDLMFPFSLGQAGGAPYPTFDADSLYYNFVVDSTGPTKCMQYFIIQMPHDWKIGSTIYPHVHYKYESAVGTPTFIMKFKCYDIGATTQKSFRWIKMGTTTGTTDKTHQMAYISGGINCSTTNLSNIIIAQIYLYSQTGTGNVHAWQFDVHYERDSMGSNKEVSKN